LFHSPPINRREALKRIFRAVVAAGAASFVSYRDLLAAVAKPTDQRPTVVWLHGTSCTGCSCSFLDIDYVPVVDIITQFANLAFHPDVSLATGGQVTDILDRLKSSGQRYIFVLEGGIPVAMPHACIMAERPMTEWVETLASRADACIAAGTCAAMGGIPKMNGTVTGSMTLDEYLAHRGIEKPVVNLPNCPMKPEHFVYTLLHLVQLGRLPDLDDAGRPLQFFAYTNHERCVLYADFQEKRFATRVGEPGCLLKLGCQGPVTKSDCLVNGHNGNTNTCIKAGHPCIGCAGERFPRQIMLHAYDDKRVIKKEF
jgi:hydrogenase small subunit